VSGFILDSTPLLFPGFFLLGLVSLWREHGKGMGLKVMAMAAVCTALAWL